MIRSLLIASLALAGTSLAKPIRALIVDGRNNHDWAVTTDAVRAALEATQRFEVSVATAPELKVPSNPRAPREPDPSFEPYAEAFKTLTKPTKDAFGETWKKWRPDFAAHDVVVLNYNGPDWTPEVKTAFVDYVKNGGGVLLIHAANNAFRNWHEFNDIIGMGWRPNLFGRALKIDPETGETYVDKTARGSGHGSKHAFQIAVRKPDHPIMEGLPKVWKHGRDELYHHMRGPAANVTILSSAFSDPKTNGTGKHEPITWEVAYGKGKAIVTTMGHFWRGDTTWEGLHCVGFQTVVARSCEYLAEGKVSTLVPAEFPTADEISAVTPSAVTWSLGHPLPSPARANAEVKKEANPYCTLTPEESLATFDLAPGYIAELVAAEPQVQEPCLTVWDANGVMYVAELRSYMQNVEGEGTKTMKNGRVKRLEDTNGDGNYNRVTTFVDGLLLPRMILPLDDRILVRETDTMDVIAYRDTDGDGVADENEMVYKRGGYGRGNVGTSVEHQDSGLVWNIDNHIYISYNIERYRFTDGDWKAEKQRSHWTQWGLTHNDVGDLFWIHNSDPMVFSQLHPKYWENVNRLAGKGIHGIPIDTGKPYDAGFNSSESLCLLNDRGGSAPAVRGFTSACGQSVFRGHKLPFADRGDYFFCDPTIHVVRRANLSRKDGLHHLEKAEPDAAEFLRSPDINSRFINTATGPDGCLYVTDMYRGIIQDAPWLSPGPRENIVKNGLDKNIQHGRIWRIRHEDFTPGARPQMLGESTVELLRHLEHPNGWWRDTAQKLIILRDDRDTVVPLLRGTAKFSQNPLARLHALWTLEGIGSLEREFVYRCFADRDPRVRRAAAQIAERWLDTEGVESLTEAAEDRDPGVAQQLILTLGMTEDEKARPRADELIQTAARKHMKDRGVMLAGGVALWGKKELPLVKDIEAGKGIDPLAAAMWKNTVGNWNRGLNFPKDMDKDHQRLVRDGEVHYFRSCASCHGADGKGLKVAGTDQLLAPSLADSKRVKGNADQLVPILLHGLMGPLDGKTYQAGFMAPAAALGLSRERDIAQVLSYIRYAWGGEGGPITETEIKEMEKATADRKTPWTQVDLEKR